MDLYTYGYAQKVLTIDLSTETYQVSNLPSGYIRDYIGGKGLAAKILYDELTPHVSPLSADNVVLFVNGPLTGTLAPTGSRCVLATKSPLTGGWLDSNCGGVFGNQLKAAGFDVLKIKGRARNPVYLLIHNDRVTFKDAAHLWGADTFSTHERLKQEHGQEYKVACIGPAGEKEVLIAGVQSEGRSFGRGGGGAVLGSKNLKALAIHGNKPIRIYDSQSFVRACREAFNEVMINPDTGGARTKYGTSSIYSFIRETGVLPVKNFQGGDYPGSADIDEDKIASELYEKDRACFACPIACSKYSTVKHGKYKDTFGEGPEYENVWSLGAQCGNSNLGAVLHAEYLCDYYGLDSVSTGNIIGFLMECYEKNIVTENDIGFSAAFGDDDALIKLVHLIGRAEKIGRILGQGVYRAAKEFGGGSERFAMHVKGMELPAYDPRAAVGMGLAFATSDRGGCHLRAWPVGAEVLDTQGRLDPLSAEYKAELVKAEQDWFSVVDSIGICLFAMFALGPNQITKLLTSLTGIEAFSSGSRLLTIGERVYNLTRLFNIREGAVADILPARLLEEGSIHRTAAGNVVPLQEMLNEYYLIRGWDSDGKPTKKQLRQLRLC